MKGRMTEPVSIPALIHRHTKRFVIGLHVTAEEVHASWENAKVHVLYKIEIFFYIFFLNIPVRHFLKFTLIAK